MRGRRKGGGELLCWSGSREKADMADKGRRRWRRPEAFKCDRGRRWSDGREENNARLIVQNDSVPPAGKARADTQVTLGALPLPLSLPPPRRFPCLLPLPCTFQHQLLSSHSSSSLYPSFPPSLHRPPLRLSCDVEQTWRLASLRGWRGRGLEWEGART